MNGRRYLDGLRVLVTSGIPTGVVMVGVGSRLAMLVLRVTSPHHVIGVTSDDGFTIGEVTLAGTYNLLVLGAVVGLIGAAAYQMVAPWLIGPTWFRRVTTGLASGAVVGSMLIHADGIDFKALKPTWLAIGLFIALPGLFGSVIGAAVDRVRRADHWTAQGRRRWLVPLVCVACFPPTALVVVVAALVFAIWVLVTEAALAQRLRRARLYALAMRSAWLIAAVLGLVALINDTRAVYS